MPFQSVGKAAAIRSHVKVGTANWKSHAVKSHFCDRRLKLLEGPAALCPGSLTN